MATNVIPSDAPSIFDSLSTAQKVALAYPSPLPRGIAGLIFDWVGEEKLGLKSDITDSWIEDNTAIHDQIALPPERFTLDASTAEIVFAPSPPASATPQGVNPLPLNPPLVPALTPGAQQAYSANSAPVTSSAPGTASFWQQYQGLQSADPTRQSTVMGFIYQLWKGRCLFTVETPWGIFTSMAIEASDSVQPEETLGVTNHRITFKKVNVAPSPDVLPSPAVGRALNQFIESNPQSTSGDVGTSDVGSAQEQQLFQNWQAATSG